MIQLKLMNIHVNINSIHRFQVFVNILKANALAGMKYNGTFEVLQNLLPKDVSYFFLDR
jgi:hypothetical protein